MARDRPIDGRDGPYPAPIETGPWRVLPAWTDYNGHMNVGYYTLAVDQAMDAVLDHWLGLGEAYVAAAGMGPFVLQMQGHYLAEMLEGERFRAAFLLLDHDAKRMHVLQSLIKETGETSAIFEILVANVDLAERRTAPYPEWAAARLAACQRDHQDAPRPPMLGRPLGIRRGA